MTLDDVRRVGPAVATATGLVSLAGDLAADPWGMRRDNGGRDTLGLWCGGRGNRLHGAAASAVMPQLTSVGHWEATTDQTWGVDWYCNEGVELTFVTAGRVPFSFEGEDVDVFAGDLTITRPGRLHRIGRPCVPSSSLTWLTVDVKVRAPGDAWVWPTWLPIPAEDLSRLTALLSQSEASAWRASKALLAAVATLDRVLKADISQPRARIAASAAAIFIELGDLLEQGQPRLDRCLSSTERTVDAFLMQLPSRVGEQWTVDRMASECGLGRTRFVRHCHTIVAVSPQDFLMRLRIVQARRLLLESDLGVTDIARLCGFQSSQYFATAFRRYTGIQPTRLRREVASAVHGGGALGSSR